jgi:uncharacterized protein (UPF0332 family)
MNGSDFYTLAVALSSGNSPAELRTVTSRAYYAAFHQANELLRSIGIHLPSGPESHKKLRWILDQADDLEVRAASAKLTSLRNARNDADYELADSKAESRKNVALSLHAANEIIACIASCLTGGPKAGIHDGLRQYAKGVLKL